MFTGHRKDVHASMILFYSKDLYSEYGCISQFKKNETATMFFLEKPSLVGSCCVEVDLSDFCVSYCGWLLWSSG